MSVMDKIIVVLSGLLFLVGSVLLLSGAFFSGSENASFADEKAYEAERGQGALPANSPELPTCASEVVVEKDDAGVQKLSFVCEDRIAREAYVAQVKNTFEWNIFIREGNRIEIERVTPVR